MFVPGASIAAIKARWHLAFFTVAINRINSTDLAVDDMKIFILLAVVAAATAFEFPEDEWNNWKTVS